MAEEGITIKGRDNKLMVGNTNVSVDNRTGASVRGLSLNIYKLYFTDYYNVDLLNYFY